MNQVDQLELLKKLFQASFETDTLAVVDGLVSSIALAFDADCALVAHAPNGTRELLASRPENFFPAQSPAISCPTTRCNACNAGPILESTNSVTICLPAAQRPVGQMYVRRRNGAIFSREDLDFLPLLALLAGSHISRYQLTSDLLRNNNLIDALHNAQSAFISRIDARKVLDSILDTLLLVTESEYGYIAEVFYDSPTQPWMRTLAMTNIAWDEPTQALWRANAEKGFEFRNLKTLFGQALLDAKPFVANNPAQDPRRGGLPPGHPALNAFLALPILDAGEQIGSIGISNRPGGYDQNIIDFLRPLLSTCSAIFRSLRIQRERDLAHAKLEENEKISNLAAQVATTLVTEGSIGSTLAACVKQIQHGLPEACVWISTKPDVGVNSSLEFGEIPKEKLANWTKAAQKLSESVIHEGQYKENQEFSFPDDSSIYRVSVYPLIVDHGAVGLLWITSSIPLTPGVCRGIRSIADAIALGIQRLHNEETLVKQSAELAQLNVELRELADLKDRFVAVTSHEFRTPLSVILSSAELLERYSASWTEDKKGQHFTKIRKSIQYLQQMLEEVLILGRVESGEWQVQLERFALSELIREITDAFHEAFARLQIVCQDLDSYFWMDQQLWRQIVFNLVSNALKFSPEKQPVQITLRVIDGSLTMTIEDHGIGIPMNDQARIGEPFHRGSNARDISGTGLGFSIVKECVKLLGGTIELRSQSQQGTTITVRIPPENPRIIKY